MNLAAEVLAGLDRRARLDALRADPDAFFSAAGLGDPAGWQSRVLRSSARKQILLCCRQAGKSTVTGAVAMHEAIFSPPAVVIMVSPTEAQSKELFRRALAFYRPEIAPSAKVGVFELELKNGSRILALPNSEEGVRGYTATTVIVDEARGVPDQLFQSVSPMTSRTGGRRIVMSTPKGKRGLFYEWWSKGEDWDRTLVTADDCPWLTPEFLESERRDNGNAYVRSEYYCEFMDLDVEMFREEDVAAAYDAERAAEFRKVWK